MGFVIVGISLFTIIVVAIACVAYIYIFGASEDFMNDDFEEYDAGYNNQHDKSDSQESDNK